MRNYLKILIVICAFSQESLAFSLEKYGLGFGVLNSGMFTESVGDDGKPSVYGSTTLHFLTAHLRWQDMSYRYSLRLGYTVIPRETADGAAKVSQLIISPQFGVPLGTSGRLLWNSSLGFLRTESKGQGGTIVLNDGTGTSTFHRPSDTATSMLLNLESGIEYSFSTNWHVSGDLLINGLLGDKRNLSLFISFGYSWGTMGSGGGGGFY